MKVSVFIGLCAVAALGLWGCGGETKNENDRRLARVHERYLYASDLDGIGRGLNEADSSAQAAAYIDKWIEDQLLYDAAEKNVEATPRIERLVADYRASLILAEYEAALLKEQLDTVVTPDEIAQYYTKNKEQYQRGEDWLRCHFMRINRESADAETLRRYFKEDSRSRAQEIGTIGQKNKATFQLDDARWVQLVNISSRLPADLDIARYLDGTVLDRTDGQYLYLLKVFEYRDKNDAAPLQEVQAEIRQIIVYMREQAIRRQLRQDIYNNAKSGGFFELY